MVHPALKVGIVMPLLLAVGVTSGWAGTDDNVIQLERAPRGDATSESTSSTEHPKVGVPRRGFDHASFETKLEALWFQRRTFLESGRDQDAALQLEKIRAFCAAEGIERLEDLAGALVTEAGRSTHEGNYKQALLSLYYAETFDPSRAQIPLTRAAVQWKGHGGPLVIAAELLSALQKSFFRSLGDLSLFPQILFVAGLGLAGLMFGFSVLMVVRHQLTFRHEVEEWTSLYAEGGWPRLTAWILLGLPLVTWIGVGWAVVYWLVLMFRFMTRSERLATLALLACGVAFLPLYNVAVGLYGMTADPAVRTTLASVRASYDPDRIVRLRRLVEAHPEDPTYRFLLAGLYKSGRHYDDAYSEYRRALESDPTFADAYVNVGNIFFATGQYSEAITHYNLALERDPDLFLAHFNLHVAQSEDFRFHAAEASLKRAHEIDPDRVARLLSDNEGWSDRPAVHEARLDMASAWEAALGGRRPWSGVGAERGAGETLPKQFLQPFPLVFLFALGACGVSMILSSGGDTARRCIRCGRPFCHRCKSGREAREYCSQCLHLYVLKDGLAPETKTAKLYEVNLHERRTRRTRRAVSAVMPGSVHVLRGKTGRGAVLLLLWFIGLAAGAPVLLPLAGVDGPELIEVVLTGPSDVPVGVQATPAALLAVGLIPCLWLAGNFWQWRRKAS